MVETAPTLGSVQTTTEQKRRFAKDSLAFNVRDTNFQKLFSDYVELHQQQIEERKLLMGDAANDAPTMTSEMAALNAEHREMQGVLAAAAGVIALVSIWVAIRCL